MRAETEVLVLGGGMTGLCAGFYAARTLGRDKVLILEADSNVGGTTRTDHIDGFSIDWGSNGFLNREPKTLEWVDDLNIQTELISANTAAAHRFILKDDRLHEVVGPPMFLLTPLLSWKGRARLMCEPFIPAKRDNAPESIWSFAARRIGREAADMMVTPMVSGVFGGDAKVLSLEHCFPRMASMEREYGGLVKALIAKRLRGKAVSPTGPSAVLTSFGQGIGFLPETAARALGERVLTGTRATRVERQGAGYRIATESGNEFTSRTVIMALPAHTAARLTADLDQGLSTALTNIAYADIAVVCTAYRRGQVGHPVNGFGFLAPRNQGKRVLGCLWTSSIFPNQAPDGWVLLRSMYGGYGDPNAVRLSDTELLACLTREVHPLLGIASPPEFMKIIRHERGIPQYLLHHGKTLEAIEAAEKRLPGLALAGNAYRGVSLNDCVVSARRAVETVAP